MRAACTLARRQLLAGLHWIKCRACEGEGEVEIETQPIEMEDLEFGPIYTKHTP